MLRYLHDDVLQPRIDGGPRAHGRLKPECFISRYLEVQLTGLD